MKALKGFTKVFIAIVGGTLGYLIAALFCRFVLGSVLNSLGAIPALVASLIFLWIMKSSAKKLDESMHNDKMSRIAAKAKTEGMELREYIYKDVPQSCIGMCEYCRGKPEELDRFLKNCLSDKRISRDAYYYLYEEYKM
jgi:uncharacterized membrane protein YeaQ/YmgE (transglycosylase-associated protein family)